jgi:ferredoxin/flavodoxin---NADP+ reductase
MDVLTRPAPPPARRPLPPRPGAGTRIGRSLPAGAGATRGQPVEPNATIVERDDVSPSIVRLRVRPDDGVPAFWPGQYFALGLTVDGRLLQRPYSTASPAGETDALEFLIRLVPHGELTPRLWPLGAGARVRLGRPKGLFGADPGDTRRPVFIATGTGVAPLLSMLESGLREPAGTQPAPPPVLVHGVARAHDLAYRARLESLAARGHIVYVPTVSRPADPANTGWSGVTGRVDGLLPALLADQAADPLATVAFVCGNPAMTDAATATLVSLGVPADAVRTEAYWVPSSPA